MRFISELIEKKRSDATPAAAQAVALPAAHGVARHGMARPDLLEIRETAMASVRDSHHEGVRFRDPMADESLDDAPAECAPRDDAGDTRPEPLLLRPEDAAEPIENGAWDVPEVAPASVCGMADEAQNFEFRAADEAPEETEDAIDFAEDRDPAEEGISIRELEQDDAEEVVADVPATPSVNLDKAFESPLQAFPADEAESKDADEALETQVSGDSSNEDYEHELNDVRDVTEVELEESEVPSEVAQPGAASDETMEHIAQTLRIWDLDREEDVRDSAEDEPPVPSTPSNVSSLRQQSEPVPGVAAEPTAEPAQERPRQQRAGRVKTRLLGFHRPDEVENNPFARPSPAAPAESARFPVGWLVVVKGPGRGASYALFDGVSTIGRADDQAVTLDHGDTSISRENHAAIAYDDEQQTFFIGHGGKANLVRLNGMPVLSTEPLTSGDQIRIGETTLRFVALCGSDFSWDEGKETGARDAATL
ncbi:FHA domain-containing protein [Tropicimonas marinistellae]|uniref:FHA domain-containing protein n=1 Tax=Tropicimonas marinistellae TaxID=1739787 RepID=UPI00082B50E0|nr:FHA domain-containing protein [Tropicimonas marinistellae]